jgi:hypothetical protein
VNYLFFRTGVDCGGGVVCPEFTYPQITSPVDPIWSQCGEDEVYIARCDKYDAATEKLGRGG